MWHACVRVGGKRGLLVDAGVSEALSGRTFVDAPIGDMEAKGLTPHWRNFGPPIQMGGVIGGTRRRVYEVTPRALSDDGSFPHWAVPVVDDDCHNTIADDAPHLLSVEQATDANMYVFARSGRAYCAPPDVGSQVRWPNGIKELQCERSRSCRCSTAVS